MKDIAKKALEAGVDIVLECTGKLENMVEVLDSVSKISINKFANLLLN